MKSDVLKEQLRDLEPLYLANADDGSLRIMERSGRGIYEVAADATDDEQVIASVRSILTESVDSERQPPIRIFIHVLYEALAREDITRTLVALAEFIEPPVGAYIIIHSAEPAMDWQLLKSRVTALRQTLARQKEVEIRLVAPFSGFQQVEMEELFNLGLRVRFAAGWTLGCPADQVLMVDTETLRNFSELGFRASIDWYIHSDNIADFEEQMPDLLMENYSSGFSIPLVSENPYFQFGPGFPNLPAASEYCQLLVRNYKRYPYYDDILFPLNSLAHLIKESGWHTKLDVPAEIKLLVDGGGNVSVYRQSPALAQRWMSVSETLDQPAEKLRASYVEFVHQLWSWDKVAYCRPCRWKYICGGIGASANGHVGERALDTICGYRKLFLEHFASLRAPESRLPSVSASASP